MKITVMTTDEQIITLEVDRNESVENLKALLDIETQVPLQQQQLLFNGKEMRNAETLSGLGVAFKYFVFKFSIYYAMRVIINDQRHGVLRSLGEWKQAFIEFLAQKNKT